MDAVQIDMMVKPYQVPEQWQPLWCAVCWLNWGVDGQLEEVAVKMFHLKESPYFEKWSVVRVLQKVFNRFYAFERPCELIWHSKQLLKLSFSAEESLIRVKQSVPTKPTWWKEKAWTEGAGGVERPHVFCFLLGTWGVWKTCSMLSLCKMPWAMVNDGCCTGQIMMFLRYIQGKPLKASLRQALDGACH